MPGPDPSRIQRTLDHYREALDAGEAGAFRQLDRVYGESWALVSRDFIELSQKIATAPLVEIVGADGVVTMGVPPSWVLQLERYRVLLGDLAGVIEAVAGQAERMLPAMQQEALLTAVAEARSLAAGEDWANVPERAVTAFVGYASDGSPLAGLFGGFRTQAGQVARQMVENAIVAGMARGRALPRVAEDLRSQVADLTATRAKTIVRTETLRAYREGSRQAFMANGKSVGGWIWHCSTTGRHPGCSACFAMHGTFHEVYEHLDGHVNCRCRMVPVRKDFLVDGELILPGDNPLNESGHEAFSKLDPKMQRRILGPSRYELWKTGAVPMEAFGTRTVSSRWGTSRQQATLKTLKARAANPITSAADKALAHARQVESATTATLQDLATKVGGDLAGVEHRLKAADSFANKIERTAIEKRLSTLDAVGQIHDAVRYTLRLDPTRYAEGTLGAVQRLSAAGATNTKFQNTWGDAPGVYHGINSNWRLPNGVEIELQFHTPASWIAKTSAHEHYQISRDPKTTPQAAEQALSAMEAIFSAIPIPPGAGGLRLP